MILRFKQRFFSWFDSYDIYDENGNVYFTVEGLPAFGHEFHIRDKNGVLVGRLKQQLFRFLPHFEIYEGEKRIGEIIKEFSFFTPRFTMDFRGWEVEGDYMQWEYRIVCQGQIVADIHKVLFQLTDTYEIETREENALHALMAVLAIDAVKCSQK